MSIVPGGLIFKRFYNLKRNIKPPIPKIPIAFVAGITGNFIPAHAAGDLIIIYVRSLFGGNAPNNGVAPAGFTTIAFGASVGSLMGFICCYAIDTLNTLNSAVLPDGYMPTIGIYRNCSGIGAISEYMPIPSTGNITRFNPLALNVSNGSSWCASMSLSNSRGTITVPPVSSIIRVDKNNVLVSNSKTTLLDTNGGVASLPADGFTVSVSSDWRSLAVELLN